MSSSHLFLGLPIALLVLYFELSSGFHTAAFINHLSLGDVAFLSASFHFIFLRVLLQHRIFAFPIFSMASSVLLFMYSIQSFSSITVVSISSPVSFYGESEHFALRRLYHSLLLFGGCPCSRCVAYPRSYHCVK